MPNLQPNTMTVIQLEDYALDELIHGLSNGARKLSIMLEVEPDGSPAVKLKLDEGRWSPPFVSDASAHVERLYDEPATHEPLPDPAKWDSMVHLAGHLGHGCTLAGRVLEAAGRDERTVQKAR